MRIITGVIGVFFAIVYALIVFGQSALTFAYSQPYLLDNLTLLLIVLALLGLMLLARRRFAKFLAAPARCWRLRSTPARP